MPAESRQLKQRPQRQQQPGEQNSGDRRAQPIQDAQPAGAQGQPRAGFGDAQLVPGLAAALGVDSSRAQRQREDQGDYLQRQRREIQTLPEPGGQAAGVAHAKCAGINCGSKPQQ